MAGCRVMGVVNATPDSFSDGGRFLALEAALSHARRLLAEGAEIIDIGGESTRPGAEAVSEADEIARVVPLIEALSAETGALISIDTRKPAVARAAIAAGAAIWNDVSALAAAPDSLAAAAELGCTVVLMHMRGEPATMDAEAHYDHVVGEVCAFLTLRAAAAMDAGIAPERVWVDPGLGFAKTAEHNLQLLAGLETVVQLGFPVVAGASRKRFISRIDPAAREPSDRLGGSIAAALAAARAGAAAVRVHDVRETVQALKVQAAIEAAQRGRQA